MGGKELKLFPLFSFAEIEYVAGGQQVLSNIGLCSRRTKTVSLLLGWLYKSSETDKEKTHSLGRGLLWRWVQRPERLGWWGLGLGGVWNSYHNYKEDREVHGPLWSMFGWGRNKGATSIRLFWLPITIKTDPSYDDTVKGAGEPGEVE